VFSFLAPPSALAYDSCWHSQSQWQSCMTPQSLCFLSRYIVVIIIWCRRSASALPLLISSLTPWGKSSVMFAPVWTFILFYLVHPEPIPPSCKSTYLFSRSFVHPCRAFGGYCTLRTDDHRYPDLHIARFQPYTHILFCPFFRFPPLYRIWPALGVNSFAPGICLYLFSPHVCHRSRWFFLGSVLGVVHSSRTDERCALCPFHTLFRLSCRQATIDSISVV